MVRTILASIAVLGSVTATGFAFEVDEFSPVQTGGAALKITFIGHASLSFAYEGYVIHVDPVAAQADYTTLPKADLILVTHEHSDHLDAKAIAASEKPGTAILLNESSRQKLGKGTTLAVGQKTDFHGIGIEAAPAYNLGALRQAFHPKTRLDNGYILSFGKLRIYVAGDTEDIPDMLALKNIDIAFLPMNQPYTMTPAQVAHAAKSFQPKILYPYHFGKTDLSALKPLLADEKNIEVRYRKLE